MHEEDRFSRSPGWFVPVWVFLGSATIIAGALCRTDISCHWRTLFVAWPWSESLPVHLGRTAPAVLGAVSLVTICFRNSKSRGAAITLAVIVALVSYYAAALVSEDGWAIQALVQMILGAAMVASGTHVMRRAPHRRLPRILVGIGGGILFLPFVSKEPFHGKPILSEMAGDLFYGPSRAAALFAALLLAYAVLGALNPFARRHLKARSLAVHILGSVLLMSFPVALPHEWWVWNRWGYEPQRSQEYALMLKFWLLGTGHTVLLAVGLTAWIEEILLEREPAQPPPGFNLDLRALSRNHVSDGSSRLGSCA